MESDSKGHIVTLGADEYFLGPDGVYRASARGHLDKDTGYRVGGRFVCKTLTQFCEFYAETLDPVFGSSAQAQTL